MRQWLLTLIAITIVSSADCTSSQTATTTATSVDKCQVQVSTSPTTFPNNGGTGSLTVNTTPDCVWSAAASANWVSLANASGQGDATMSYTVAPNAVPQMRTASLSVGDHSVQIVEAPACSYALSSSAAEIGSAGGSLAVALQTSSGCAWTASSDSGWLAVTTGTSGNTSATIVFSAAANPGSLRVAHALIGGQNYAVTQAAASAPSPSPVPSPTPPPAPVPIPPSTPIPSQPSPQPSDPAHGDNGNGNGNDNGQNQGNGQGHGNGQGNGNGKGG